MVKPNLKYELNHIDSVGLASLGIAIGVQNSTAEVELQLFEKSLALTSDLKRLPILRSKKGIITFGGNIGGLMGGSGLGGLTATINLYNGIIDTKNIIDVMEVFVSQSGNIIQSTTENHESWDLEGGILLKDKLTMVLALSGSGLVAAADIPAGILFARWLLEIDWTPVSKKEFEEFILESVYAEQD